MSDQDRCQTIETDLRNEIAALLGRDEGEVSADTSLESLGIDSIRLVEILIFIERQYGVRLMDAGLDRESLRSPASLARRVAEIEDESS